MEKFKILVVDLSKRKVSIELLDGREEFLGGSGLCARLFSEFGKLDKDPFHPDQPIILAVGPLTGLFPMMSKTIMAFRSPYNFQYEESHAGGRSSMAIRLSGYDAIVIVGRAEKLSVLNISSRYIKIESAPYLKGLDIFATGKIMRRLRPSVSGQRSILRIGPAGERLVPISCVNVDTYRHFGRLGSGAIFGSKNLKGIIITGDSSIPLPEDTYKEYVEKQRELFEVITKTKVVHKYHDLGTAENLIPLNELRALPWRNLNQTSDRDIDKISGEYFGDNLLLRQVACAGCPVGCIHIGLLREAFGEEHEFVYHQVSYDYEPIFALGTMLGVVSAEGVLKLIEETEKWGLDAISTGGSLAWATEALKKNIITTKETIVDLKFGDEDTYLKAIKYLGNTENDFYKRLGNLTNDALKYYGGEDFACVLGQEMAGYATGENYFVAQALGFRHSHLDLGAYSFDQKEETKDVKKAIEFFEKEEIYRCFLCSLVGCLFARGAYSWEKMSEALSSIGLCLDVERCKEIGRKIQRERWKLKFKTGFDPEKVKIPKRFLEVINWKGPIDKDYLLKLKKKYGDYLRNL